ncbi:dienelactone hydrolase [Deinococcus sonorensis]|uniref:Dienelactone hydrolase n=1 Tax=Deinococcus sonorensis KR-87 TaxID=694439 RepID=A0AAU7UEE9_9DEIO
MPFPAVVPGDPRPDAPALTARGPFPVGVLTLTVQHPDQLDVVAALAQPTLPDPLPRSERRLTVEVWYPARLADGQLEQIHYADRVVPAPGQPATPLEWLGRAVRDAAPEPQGGPHPLVLVSHGYPGSRYLLSYLCENLASKGYVVAAIDHTDSTYADLAAFASTLLNRPLDDQVVLDRLDALSAPGSGSPLSGLLDTSRTALIGYSMGGYGALNFAGAGFAPQTLAFVPGGALAGRLSGAYTVDPRLKAIVTFAPWGGPSAVRGLGVPAAEFGVWDAEGLAGVRVPCLFIAGDQDDVSGYRDGVRALFERAVHSERRMVVYRNARHNVAPNPPPPAADTLAPYMHYAEPAWDARRLNDLNCHFVTAFLNAQLKGETEALTYLDAPDGPGELKGFPARTSLGIELHRRPAR